MTASGAYLKLTTTVSNSDNVTLQVDQAAVATIGDITELQKQIENINIGGRNLLLNSDFSEDFTVTTTSNKYGLFKKGSVYTVTRDSEELYNGANTLKVVGTEAGSNSVHIAWDLLGLGNINPGSVAGKNITISFYAKSLNCAKIDFRLAYGTYSDKNIELSNDWKRYEIPLTQNAPQHYAGQIIFKFNKADTVWLANVKVEFGNKSTDWTPAPEDKANKSDLDTKMNLHRDTKALTAKGWYRVAEFIRTGIYIVNITQRWNELVPSSYMLLLNVGEKKFNISILDSSTCNNDGSLGISQVRLVKDIDSTGVPTYLEIYYNYNASNNVTVQIINESIDTNVNTIHFTETTSEDIFVKATKDMRILHLDDAIGTLSSLTTTDKTSLVNAVNELRLFSFLYMRGNNIDYTSILSNKTFDDAMNLGYSTIFTINGNDETANGNGFPTGAYQYGLLITLFASSDYAKVQIYIPDKPSERGFYIRTKGDPWCHFSGEIVQPISINNSQEQNLTE